MKTCESNYGTKAVYHLRQTYCILCCSPVVKNEIITVAGPEVAILNPTSDGSVLVIAILS